MCNHTILHKHIVLIAMVCQTEEAVVFFIYNDAPVSAGLVTRPVQARIYL